MTQTQTQAPEQPKAAATVDQKWQLMPPLTAEERAMLKEDIREKGILVPLEYDEDGELLDGHHRLELWQELRAEGVDLPMYNTIVVSVQSDGERADYVYALNLKRRHLSHEDRAALFVQLRARGWTLSRVAELAGVDPSTVMRQIDSTLANAKVDAGGNTVLPNGTVIPAAPGGAEAGGARGPEPEYTMGKDGKMRPTKYTPRAMTMILAKDVERAIKAEQRQEQPAPVQQIAEQYFIIIECRDEAHQAELLERFMAEGLECRAMLS